MGWPGGRGVKHPIHGMGRIFIFMVGATNIFARAYGILVLKCYLSREIFIKLCINKFLPNKKIEKLVKLSEIAKIDSRIQLILPGL